MIAAGKRRGLQRELVGTGPENEDIIRELDTLIG
jgi:hypothetical protein